MQLVCINRRNVVEENSRPGVEKARCLLKNETRTPLMDVLDSFLRRKGDSNPRYSYPYDSLANCWFKPLTHLSSRGSATKSRFIT